MKLTYLPVIALVFLVRSRRALAALIAGCALQFAISCWIQGGVAWLQDYAKVMRAFRRRPIGAHMPTLHTVLGGGLLFYIAACAIYACLLRMAIRVPIEVALTAALPIAIIAAPHGYIYDFATAVPLFAYVLSLDTWAGRAAILPHLTPLPYVLLTSEKIRTPRRRDSGARSRCWPAAKLWNMSRNVQPRRDAEKPLQATP